MAWQAEPIRYFLKVTNIGKNRRDFSSSQEYTPKKYFTDISLTLCLSTDDAEVKIRPYTMEHLKQLVEEDYRWGIVNELFVGIRNGTDIANVGMYWVSKQFNEKRINQYFFDDNQPSAFNFGHMSGPGWPLNQPPVLDERLTQYFNALSDVRPDVTDSLDKCMEHLTKPGPEYTGKSDGSISFKLSGR